MDRTPRQGPEAAGYLYGLAAYITWGVVPIFWKYLTHVPAVELLAHRVVWALLTCGALMWMRGRLGEIMPALRDPRTRAAIMLSALLLACNWVVFIYAVATDRMLHASLGYFINPLVSVILGMVFLGERLRRMQWLALALATAGVLALATQAEEVPWIALVLAGTFGFYGLVRKTARVAALAGSTIEALLLLPIFLVYLGYLGARGEGALLSADMSTHVLLVATGPVTALPLVWFSHAARRLPLVALGFLQYLSPTLQLLLAVVVYHEPFTAVHMRGFACIWAALALSSLDGWRAFRRASATRAP